MANFAIIDTETNWRDAVMSIGAIIANTETFEPVSSKYYIITPEHKVGGMFSHALFFEDKQLNRECSRSEALCDLIGCFNSNKVTDIFAYNASFDARHLPELSSFSWYDIMKLAAYRQYNPKIPKTADCHKTGRLKRNYGVEPILRLLIGNETYCEQHNALSDAFDELKIMTLLQHKLSNYEKLRR